jgi:phosphoribosyl 1,2-cyclic phosphodiesterase
MNEINRHGIQIYSGFETLEKHGLNNNVVGNLNLFKIGTLNIVPFSVEHDVPSFGYVIASAFTGEQLLFATDTYFIRYKFANLTHLLVECNFDRETLDPDVNDKYLERVFESHFSLQDLVLMLKANDLSKVKKIWLCHLSENNLDFEKARRTVQESTGIPTYLCLKNGGVE